MDIRPQPGPQEAFLTSAADIVIYGGAAGGGKTFGLLMEPLRHVTANEQFAAVYFRRTTPQITNPGALWDTSLTIYPLIGARPVGHRLEWHWGGGGIVKFAHLEHEKNRLDWQGAQIPLICFDELTHFTAAQFWYLLSRNRSTCGVRPYIRATCNPDADSWVAELIAWWIDQDTGVAIPARSGVIRWFVRVGERLHWADTPDELTRRFPGAEPKSLTFILSKLSDNKILMEKDPGYRANLLSLPRVERERLMEGNWKVRPGAGLYFKRGWVEVVDAVPDGMREVRGWDLAATLKTETNDPDSTSGTRMGRKGNTYYVTDHVKDQLSPAGVERLIKNTASRDGRKVEISLPQDPGAGGKGWVDNIIGALSGYDARKSPERGDKIFRFGGFSAQAEAGNVKVLRGNWNDAFFTELEAFPDAAHDDTVDSTSRAFRRLTSGTALPSSISPISVTQEAPRIN